MNLYLIEQDVNSRYETFYAAVVVADTPEEAARIHPSGNSDYNWNGKEWPHWGADYWADNPDQVKVTYLGEYPPENGDVKQRVILASINVG